MPDGIIAETNSLWLSDPYLHNINARYVRPLDYRFLASVKRPLAGRLYEVLSPKFYGLEERVAYYHIDYQDLCQTLPITPQRYFSSAQRDLKRAHEELGAKAFLAKVAYVLYDGSKEVKTVRYYPGEKAKRERNGELLRWVKTPMVVEEQLPLPQATAEQEKAVELTGIAKELYSRGVLEKVAVRLAQRYSEDRIREKVEMFDFLNSSDGLENPAGWLITAIEEDWKPSEAQLKAKAKAELAGAREKRAQLNREKEEILLAYSEKAEAILQEMISRDSEAVSKAVQELLAEKPSMRQWYDESKPLTEQRAMVQATVRIHLREKFPDAFLAITAFRDEKMSEISQQITALQESSGSFLLAAATIKTDCGGKKMQQQRRTFETRGPVDRKRNYFVPRTAEIADLVQRIKNGRYIVIFAPRQTGKTTFFRWALSALVAEDDNYFPIQLNFATFLRASVSVFYTQLKRRMIKEIKREWGRRGSTLDKGFEAFLAHDSVTDPYSFQQFLEELAAHLESRRVAMIIDEFDGIPPAALSDFLHTLREIYLDSDPSRCPKSLGIVGVKSITQLNYDRSISPFNIQDEFFLPNFTLSQVSDLLKQYTLEVGQAFAPEVIESLCEQTAGQPFLVNRMAQILTCEMDIPKTLTITMAHFEVAHKQILHERNANISHLVRNVRKDRRFESILMEILSYERGVPFNLDNEILSELASYGVVTAGRGGVCEIANPIYQYRIVRAFQPLINGLERQYLPEDTRAGFFDYLTPDGKIHMRELLKNFRSFIARVGYRILEVPESPQEFVGQSLLFGYLDTFVRMVGGMMYLEVRTGRGRMDLIILHKGSKYIVETKIWEGESLYGAGKRQLAEYLKLEDTYEGYYVVFDHRQKPVSREEEEVIDGKAIFSFTIPVVQSIPSSVTPSVRLPRRADDSRA